MHEMPKDGTPILAYCINRHTKGWMVIAYNGRYWQTSPGKYGVERIVRWAPLPPDPDLEVHCVDTPLPSEGK